MKDSITSLTSRAFTIQVTDLRNIQMKNNTSVSFIIYNIYNDLYLAIEKSADLYVDDIIDRSE